MTKNKNIVWHNSQLSQQQRSKLKNHKPAVLWFTGLSSAGKSTLANAMEVYLHSLGFHTMLLDGDNVRHGLCADLGFSDKARQENIRRVAEMAKLFVESGLIVMTAFISPFANDRKKAKEIIGDEYFIEVFCDCNLEICEERDPKGLYSKARSGLIPEFTGISSPYESPVNPEITVNTGLNNVEQCLDILCKEIEKIGGLK